MGKQIRNFLCSPVSITKQLNLLDNFFIMFQAHIGWLAGLANATDQPYTANNTGGPSIKV